MYGDVLCSRTESYAVVKTFVTIRVTESCNFDCGFCGYRRSSPVVRQSLSEGDVLFFLQGLAKARSGKIIEANWLGGEPMLWPNICAVVQEAALKYRIKSSITTNGWFDINELATPGIPFSRVIFSVDGPEAIHDRLRRKAGSWAHISRNISILQDIPCWRGIIAVNVILTKGAGQWISTLLDTLGRAGVAEVSFNGLQLADDAQYFRDKRVDDDDLANVLELTRRGGNWNGMKVLGSEHYWDTLKKRTRSIEVRVDDCTVLSDTFILEADRRVGICPYTINELFFDLHGVATEDALGESLKMLQERRRGRMGRACYNCPVNSIHGKYE